MHDILDIIRNIDDLYENNTNLSVLKDFERVLDELDMYVYENWDEGELAYGPKVDRHWITAGFMWPQSKMPNPIAAKRLTELGCKVNYKKSHLVEARPIRSPDDLRPGTKKGKLDKNPIWIVEIQMPKKVAFDIYQGYMNKLKSEYMENNAPKNGTPAPGGQPAPVAPVAGGAPTPAGAPAAPAGAPAAGGAVAPVV